MTQDIVARINEGNLLFSIFSLATCTAIIILIFFQKQLRSITYTFLMFIFGSEIVHAIGNILLFTINDDSNIEAKNMASICLIAFTDMFTNSLFVFFTYCSIKLIKETNKLIKKQVPRFIIISAIFSLLYMIAILIVALKSDDQLRLDIRFRGFYMKENKFNTDYYVLSSIHMFLIMLFSILSLRNTCVVLSFMSEKQKMDKANAKNIAKLIKILRRYPIVCILYWAFIIPRIIFVSTSEKQHILRDTLYFVSEAFFRLRGFLLFLNTYRSSKIQIIIYRLIEINLKHNCLLNLKMCRKKRRGSRTKSRQSMDKPLIV